MHPSTPVSSTNSSIPPDFSKSRTTPTSASPKAPPMSMETKVAQYFAPHRQSPPPPSYSAAVSGVFEQTPSRSPASSMTTPRLDPSSPPITGAGTPLCGPMSALPRKQSLKERMRNLSPLMGPSATSPAPTAKPDPVATALTPGHLKTPRSVQLSPNRSEIIVGEFIVGDSGTRSRDTPQLGALPNPGSATSLSSSHSFAGGGASGASFGTNGTLPPMMLPPMKLPSAAVDAAAIRRASGDKQQGGIGLSLNDFILHQEIARGASGVVYSATCLLNGHQYAVKEIGLTTLLACHTPFENLHPGKLQQLHSIVHREVAMVMRVRTQRAMSDHIVTTHEAFYKDESLYIVMDLMECGSLEDLGKLLSLDDRRSGLPERVLAVVAEQVALGLRDMHSRGQIHRDLKPPNILLDLKGCVKLSDFGLSQIVSDTVNGVVSCDIDGGCSGTDRYMSPERHKGIPHGAPADVWAFGLTLAECAIGKYPIDLSHCADNFELVETLGRGVVSWPAVHAVRLSDEFRSFVSDCMKLSPTDRPTATQLLSHPFILKWKAVPFDFAAFVRHTAELRKQRFEDVSQQRQTASGHIASVAQEMEDRDVTKKNHGHRRRTPSAGNSSRGEFSPRSPATAGGDWSDVDSPKYAHDHPLYGANAKLEKWRTGQRRKIASKHRDKARVLKRQAKGR